MKSNRETRFATLSTLVVGSAVTAFIALWQVSPQVFSLEAQAEDDAQWQPGLHSVECWFAHPADIEVDCAELRTDPARGEFTLPVVVIRDNAADHKSDPLVYLSGGPGSSSFLENNNVEHWFYWAEIAKLSRDLVLVDQRGTGLSRPQFHCHDYEQFFRNTLRENLSLQQEHQAALQAINTCVEQMQAHGYSLDDYSTTHSALDMDQALRALGYEEWNVMGGSYGTRLALEWLRHNDRDIRAVILDSVYPLDKGSLADWPGLLHNSFSFFWQACENGTLCEEADKNLEEKFWRAMGVLKETPVTLSAPLWEGGWPVKAVINDHRFLGMIYTALYDDTLHPRIIEAIDEVLNGGGRKALQKLAENSVNSELAPEFNALIYLAVDCAESAMVSREEFEQSREQYPQWSAYTEHAWQYDMCEPIARRSDLTKFKQTVSSEVPVLILSGGFDPVTPASWARELADQLPNSQHWHLDRVGHGVVSSSACVHQAFGKFLDEPFEKYSLPCE
ncbi:MAG: alpha/beta fold hydrolase [Cellvibrionaceae bacterium]